jgi:hypothetical protein
MHADIRLTLDQIHLVIAALGQLCGKAIAANEAELYGLAYSTQQIFEAHEKALKRSEP